MPKVKLVMLYFEQISYAFHQCKDFENRLRFDKVVYREIKGGNFSETQCSLQSSYLSAVCETKPNLQVLISHVFQFIWFRCRTHGNIKWLPSGHVSMQETAVGILILHDVQME